MSEITEEQTEQNEPDIEDLVHANVQIIEGIGPETTIALKTIRIRTLEELVQCNPFAVQAKLKIPLHKLMILRKKAQMILRLGFNQQIVTNLGAKKYTIEQALYEDPNVLKKDSQQDMEQVANFLDSLTHLSIFLDLDIYRGKSITVLRKAQTKRDETPLGIPLPVEAEREIVEKLLENTEVSLLLERMLEGYINELTPRWVLTSRLGYGYPEAEEIIHPRNEVTYPILLDLTKAGVLNKHFYDKISRCPTCEFTTLMLRNTCMRCSSRNLIREAMIEHYDCAHVDLISRFKADGGQLVCPKCTKELQQLGLDHSKPGVMFICRACGDITGSPVQKLFCLNCGALVKKDEGILDDVWSFTLNPEKKAVLIDLLNPKYTLISLLTEKGFKFEVDDVVAGRVRGKSEVMHFYDIYGEKEADQLLIEFFSDENQVEISSVYDLIAKAHDIGANVVVLLAFPTASSEVLKFAKYHNVTVLEGDNLATVLPIFEQQLNTILSTKFRGYP